MDPRYFLHLLRFIILLVLPLYISGCTIGPTKPKPPYAGNTYPAILTELVQKNPLIVQELGKLPEIQDGISETEMSVLKDMVELYKSNPAQFENAFNEMYKVGLPEIRKYCSPLQAFYWLLEDGAPEEARIVLNDYSLI